tara:strand:+ start:84 stop:707 length:624 start_codon:yes stop_codon:yes gene_type:complete
MALSTTTDNPLQISYIEGRTSVLSSTVLSPHIVECTDAFDQYEIGRVFNDAERFDWAEATISEKVVYLKNTRSGIRKGLIPDTKNEWLYSKISILINTLNNICVQQDWTGFLETIQFARYDVGDHYDIHFDGFKETGRKLSMSVQLSDPEDYEGGLLKIGLPNNPVTVTTEQGSVACFPSWMPHTIEPVTEGTRYSLVAWGHGPAVR